MGKFHGSGHVDFRVFSELTCSHNGSFDKICKYLEMAKEGGYEILCGGKSTFQILE